MPRFEAREAGFAALGPDATEEGLKGFVNFLQRPAGQSNRQCAVSLWIVGSYRRQRFGLVDARHGFMRFAPSLAALFERCVVQQPLTFQDRFEPTMLTLGPKPVLVSQEHANAPYAATENIQ